MPDIEPDKFLRLFWSVLGLKIFKKYKIEHIFFLAADNPEEKREI